MRTTRPAEETPTPGDARRVARSFADNRRQATALSAARSAMNGSPRSLQLQAMAASLSQRAVAQRLILAGTTHRSKAHGNLKLTAWYKNLDDDKQRFAVALHAEEDNEYTHAEAEKEIQRQIDLGIDPPEAKTDAKALRKKRVTEYVNRTAPSEDGDEYKKGEILASAGEQAFKRLTRRHRRKDGFKQDKLEVGKVKPNLFRHQQPILKNRGPFEQIFALIEENPKTFDVDLGGSEVKFDAIDVKSNDERGKKRKRDSVNLAQVFIEQPDGENSYWSKSDSAKKFRKTPQFQHLRHLEVLRDNQSATTTYLKDSLLERGQIGNREAFGDEGEYAFQEYKGALKPTRKMRAKQHASAFHVLTKALKDANAKLGTQVGAREMTTAQSISDRLIAYSKKPSAKNRLRLVREVFRLIRASTGIDIESDDDSGIDSD